MLRAKLRRLVWRMQRIGEQQQRRGDIGRLSREHARLPSAIAMTAEIDFARYTLARCRDRVTQAVAIRCTGRGRGRAFGALAAKGEVAAQHGETAVAELRCHRDQQWSG